MFWNEKFPGFEHPYNLFEYFQNKIQITLCRNVRVQMDLSKNNRFSAEEAKKFNFVMIPILQWNLKIAYRG